MSLRGVPIHRGDEAISEEPLGKKLAMTNEKRRREK
jgi:hypothetical protein